MRATDEDEARFKINRKECGSRTQGRKEAVHNGGSGGGGDGGNGGTSSATE